MDILDSFFTFWRLPRPTPCLTGTGYGQAIPIGQIIAELEHNDEAIPATQRARRSPATLHLPFQPHAHEAGEEEELAAMDAGRPAAVWSAGYLEWIVLSYATWWRSWPRPGLSPAIGKALAAGRRQRRAPAPVITSAGALVERDEGQAHCHPRRATCYMKPCADRAGGELHVREEGFEVQDWRALESPTTSPWPC